MQAEARKSFSAKCGRFIGHRSMMIVLVCMSVSIQLMSAALLKFSTKIPSSEIIYIGLFLVVIFFLGFIRLVIWNSIYSKYPVGIAYPSSAIFFPLVVGLSFALGESVSTRQVIGALVVGIGVAMVAISEMPPR